MHYYIAKNDSYITNKAYYQDLSLCEMFIPPISTFYLKRFDKPLTDLSVTIIIQVISLTIPMSHYNGIA